MSKNKVVKNLNRAKAKAKISRDALDKPIEEAKKQIASYQKKYADAEKK
eukprot:gene933-6599_t